MDFEAGRIDLPELNLTPELARRLKKITITACGTAAHAGMVGKVLIEHIARLPVEVDIASEFRYRDPLVDEDSAVLAISQSGETADTLAAMEEARRKGATLWSIVNVIGSQAMRIANGYVSMQTGPESAWPPPRPTPPRWSTCTCWRSCSAICAACWMTPAAASWSTTCA